MEIQLTQEYIIRNVLVMPSDKRGIPNYKVIVSYVDPIAGDIVSGHIFTTEVKHNRNDWIAAASRFLSKHTGLILPADSDSLIGG